MIRATHYAARLAGILAMAGLIGIALITSVDVLLRWLLGTPIDGAADMIDAALPVVVAATFVAAAHGRQHIGLGLMKLLFGARTGRAFDRLADISLALFFMVIVWQFWRYAGEIAAEGRQTYVLALKLAPFWYATTVMLALCAAIQLWSCFVPGGGADTHES